LRLPLTLFSLWNIIIITHGNIQMYFFNTPWK
jgi:hypothetical protein